MGWAPAILRKAQCKIQNKHDIQPGPASLSPSPHRNRDDIPKPLMILIAFHLRLAFGAVRLLIGCRLENDSCGLEGTGQSLVESVCCNWQPYFWYAALFSTLNYNMGTMVLPTNVFWGMRPTKIPLWQKKTPRPILPTSSCC